MEGYVVFQTNVTISSATPSSQRNGPACGWYADLINNSKSFGRIPMGSKGDDGRTSKGDFMPEPHGDMLSRTALVQSSLATRTLRSFL